MPYIKPNLQPGQFALYAINRILNTTYKVGQVANGSDYNNPDPVYGFINTYIPITYYDGTFSSKFSTYDENLSIKENAQYSLSFSIAKYLDGEINPNFYLIVENRRLRLQTYDKKIDFVITGITPQLTQNNVIYAVTCQDAFSYDLSKQRTTIDYESDVPKNIRDLANDITSVAQLTSRWTIDPKLETNYYADFPSYQKLSQGLTTTTYRMMASLSISGSTPYNALVELCKKFNASMEVEYSDSEGTAGIIYFKNKVTSSFNGYHLRDSVNLSAFSVSRKTDSLCSILHVLGGEDADGQIVNITPSMPADVQEYFTMLHPYTASSESDKYKLFSQTSYPYIVIKLGETYSLYKRFKDSSTFLLVDNEYIPWTLKTSEEIENDFNSFRQVTGSGLYFASAHSLEVTEYFNFLKYRCKSAASFFYDFEYFLRVGLMDQATFDNLENLFSKELRNANIMLYCLSYQYNMLTAKLMSLEDQEEELISQLCALEEELYYYQINPDEKPEVVNTVTGTEEESALSRTTLEAANQEERLNVLSNLMTNVWTDQYFKLLLTLQGPDALTTKRKNYAEKYKDKETIFKNNRSAAWTILDAQAAVGTIVAQATGAAPDTNDTNYTKVLYVDNYVEGVKQGQVGFTVNKDGAYTIYYNASGYIFGNNATQKFIYNNAVLDKVPTETGTSWPPTGYEELADIDTLTSIGTFSAIKEQEAYIRLDVKIYERDANSTSAKCYHFTPVIATTVSDREDYLAENSQTDYVNYSVAKQKYQKALDYITELATDTDPSRTSRATTPMRRGLYSMMLYYLDELLTNPAYGYITAVKKYSTPLNLLALLENAQEEQNNVWNTIYTNYNDYIVETNFTDSDQLSSEGLFMAAMETFSKYKNPTYEYSTTVIDAKAIANVESHELNINDIVYAYNKDISAEYTGALKVTVPRDHIGHFYTITSIGSGNSKTVYSPANEIKLQKNTSGELLEQVTSITSVPRGSVLEGIQNPCLLYCRNRNYNFYYATDDDNNPVYKTLGAISRTEAIGKYNLTVRKVVYNDLTADIYLNCPAQQAIELVTNRASIDTLEFFVRGNDLNTVPVYTNVLNIEMEETAKPIPLQITGITRKLREATSQLTVSTDRTMDLVFQRLIKQARL